MVGSRADGSRRALCGLSQPWLCWNLGVAEALVLSSEEHEVVGSTALEFFDCDGLLVLGVVLANTWVASANHEVELPLQA